MRPRLFIALLALSPVMKGAAQPNPSGSLPVLQYQMSPHFPGRPAAGTYVAINADGIIQVYDFRAFQGNFEEDFRKTLLRDWIAPKDREERLLGPPLVQAAALEGA